VISDNEKYKKLSENTVDVENIKMVYIKTLNEKTKTMNYKKMMMYIAKVESLKNRHI